MYGINIHTEVLTIIYLKVIDKKGRLKYKEQGKNLTVTYKGEFAEGDKIRVDITEGEFVAVKLDPSMSESIVHIPNKSFIFEVPTGVLIAGYAPGAFAGDEHVICAREVDDDEIYAYRNIALNSHDLHGDVKFFPHASANFVTRGLSCFYERNAIDGNTQNEGHGAYPYNSWAGGARDDLEYRIDFGQKVEVEKFVVYLRADFPHDTYWKSIDFEFSDGTTVTGNFDGIAAGQEVELPEKKETEYIILKKLTQVSYPLSWAALSQIEVYGKYIKKEWKTLEIRNASNSKDVKHYTTERLREEFHISNLFTKDNIRMVYSHIDRIITGGFMPVYGELKLSAGKELAADYFLQRREMGCINIGGKGIITIDGVDYEMNPRDGIYIGMGNKEIIFKSCDSEDPAKFYISSCPAHKAYPIVKIDITKARKVPCGSVEDCNKRVINQYIHPDVIQSCQLAMGLTQLEPGSNWNTMPCHTHDRRMEVYLYLDMEENDAVFHMMGEPTETRHIIMHNEEAVISPSWSIHTGVGTKAYSFIWAMCGENQEFDDMDFIETKDLK